MSAASRALLALAITGGVSLVAAPTRAYCQATTCDPSDVGQHCKRDTATQCLLSGEPLHWASDCLTISVQADGAPDAGIDYEAAEASVRRAFAAWTSVDCNGEKPSLRVDISGPVSCDASEYSSDHRNANIVMFRQHEWPYTGAEDALGLTRVRFDLDDLTGELWDADIEVNAVSEPLSTGQPKPDEVDLDSLLTHEAGHVLGLGHTLNVGATMIAGYTAGSEALRTPNTDDTAGICAIYPPGRQARSASCEPRHGFSERCADAQPPEMKPEPEPDETGKAGDEGGGCSFFPSRPERDGSSLLGVLGALLLGRRRRSSSLKSHQLVPCARHGLRR
jgi:hypothetical protein